MTKLMTGIYLLRKSKAGDHVPVIRDEDLPAKFSFAGRTFEISRTKKGRLIMTEVK